MPTGAPAPAACARLLAALPDEIDPGVTRRQVLGDPAAAAWGDPPVVLRCGAPAKSAAGGAVNVNGVDWAVRGISDGFRWTTLDRAVPVSVEIPARYANGAELVNPLATALLATLPAAPSPAPTP